MCGIKTAPFSSLSPLWGISSKVSSFVSWKSFISQVSGAFWMIPPISCHLRPPVSVLSAGTQSFLSQYQIIFPHPPVSLSPTHFSSQVPPSLPTCDCFLVLQLGLRHLGTSACWLFAFCGLYLGYCVPCVYCCCFVCLFVCWFLFVLLYPLII